jgi:hypothetical protein
MADEQNQSILVPVDIEAEMKKIIALDEPFERIEVPRGEALEICDGLSQKYKVEHINTGLADHASMSFYRQGEFIDLCRGPHVPSTGRLKVFKLMKVAGAYWRGDSKNEMLQRIYGTAWPTKDDLRTYLDRLAEVGLARVLLSGSRTTGVLWQPHLEQPHTRPLHTGLPHGGQDARPPEHDGSGSAATPAGGGSDQVKPASCRVRINLTPWAYYTADDDTTRRETPSTVELTPGRHRLHVWNPELHVERDITISVPADRDTMNYSEPLQPSMLAPDAGASN